MSDKSKKFIPMPKGGAKPSNLFKQGGGNKSTATVKKPKVGKGK